MYEINRYRFHIWVYDAFGVSILSEGCGMMMDRRTIYWVLNMMTKMMMMTMTEDRKTPSLECLRYIAKETNCTTNPEGLWNSGLQIEKLRYS